MGEWVGFGSARMTRSWPSDPPFFRAQNPLPWFVSVGPKPKLPNWNPNALLLPHRVTHSASCRLKHYPSFQSHSPSRSPSRLGSVSLCLSLSRILPFSPSLSQSFGFPLSLLSWLSSLLLHSLELLHSVRPAFLIFESPLTACLSSIHLKVFRVFYFR